MRVAAVDSRACHGEGHGFMFPEFGMSRRERAACAGEVVVGVAVGAGDGEGRDGSGVVEK